MYRLSNLAADDFAAIYEYTLLNFGARQADAYADDLENALRILADAPLNFLPSARARYFCYSDTSSANGANAAFWGLLSVYKAIFQGKA